MGSRVKGTYNLEKSIPNFFLSVRKTSKKFLIKLIELCIPDDSIFEDVTEKTKFELLGPIEWPFSQCLQKVVFEVVIVLSVYVFASLFRSTFFRLALFKTFGLGKCFFLCLLWWNVNCDRVLGHEVIKSFCRFFADDDIFDSRFSFVFALTFVFTFVPAKLLNTVIRAFRNYLNVFANGQRLLVSRHSIYFSNN